MILKRAGAGLVIGLASLTSVGLTQPAIALAQRGTHVEATFQQDTDLGGIVQQPTDPGTMIHRQGSLSAAAER